MNKLPILALLLGIGLVGCGSDSGAYDAFKEFDQALTDGDFERALKMAANTSPAKGKVLLEKARGKLLPDSSTIRGSSYSLETESIRRTVTLTVRQQLEVEDAGSQVTTLVYLHEVVLQETDSGWRVISFDRNLQE